MKRQPWPDWDTTVPSKTPTLALQGPLPPLPAVLINRPTQALRHWPSILTDPLSLARLHVLISGLEIQPQGADDRMGAILWAEHEAEGLASAGGQG